MIERAAASAGFERKAHPRMPRHACGCRNGANGRHSPRRCCRLSGLVGAAFQDESTRRNESARPQPGELRGIVVGSAIDGSPIGTPASDEFFEILHVVYRDLSRGLKHGWALDCPARPEHRSNSWTISTNLKLVRASPNHAFVRRYCFSSVRFWRNGVMEPFVYARVIVPDRSISGVLVMFGWALSFLIIALIAAVLGFGGIAGLSIEIAKIIFFVAIVLFAISAVVALVRGRSPTIP
jgi:uncharacterized membrane protein YtjA (UPF0391 family)